MREHSDELSCRVTYSFSMHLILAQKTWLEFPQHSARRTSPMQTRENHSECLEKGLSPCGNTLMNSPVGLLTVSLCTSFWLRKHGSNSPNTRPGAPHQCKHVKIIQNVLKRVYRHAG